jgi:dipeptidyl aminopeptidase/acylaminoacyl peptidase
VGFVNERTLQLTIVDIGTAVTAVVSTLDSADLYGMSEGPGDSIVFAHDSRSAAVLKRVPIAGGVPAVVAQPDASRGEVDFFAPTVVAEQNEILLTVLYKDGHHALEALSLATGTRRVVVDNAMAGHLTRHGYLVYFRPTQRTAPSSSGDLVLQRVAMPSLAAQGNPVPLVTGVQHAQYTGGRGVDADVAADTLLVLRSSDVSLPKSLAWIDRTGAVTSIAAALRLYRQPDLSPDGNRVAFQLDESARDIWVYDLVRDIASSVTRSRATEETPRWSPDGRSLVYMGDYEGKESLLLAAADGSQPVQRLWTFEGHSHLDGWRADGQLLYVDVRDGSDQGIWVYSFPKKTAAVFLQTSANEFAAEPSPDGRWVAYVSDESGKEQVYLRRSGGTGRVQVSRDGGVEPVWSPDGRELFFRQLDRSALLAVSVGPGGDAQLGSPTVLFTLPFVSGGRDRAYDVSPDGRRFLVIRTNPDAAAQDIEITVNFSERLQPLAGR